MKTSPALFTLLCLSAATLQATDLWLDGVWLLQLDPKDEGVASRIWEKPFEDTIQLPGTTALAGKGEPLSLPLNLERPAMQSLHQRFRYVGPAWYQRTIQAPSDWESRDLILTLERVIWESRVWVNGHEVGPPRLSLTAPHRHDLTRWIKPGAENTLTIRIDNREKLSIGVMGHSYTDETQTIWNGIVGRIALEARPRLRIESLKLRPDLARQGVAATVAFTNHTGEARRSALTLTPSAGVAPHSHEVEIPVGTSSRTFFLPLPPDTARWSEFTPVTHSVTALLVDGTSGAAAGQPVVESFGLREFKTDGRHFTINGRRTFLRGTVQCAEFPQTGHPDMTGAQWEKIFTTARAYGLNHLRFHSWCPPEVAFEIADRLGFYLQVELPNWTFKMGKIPSVDAWLNEEAATIFQEYGNHPSFVLFSLGNELEGDFDHLDACIADYRKLEPQLLFTSTSFAFAPRGKAAGPQDDFFISQETASGWVRGQGFLNNTRPNTVSDYAEGLASIPVPLVTHEVGQYVVYPNLAELPKYESTPMRATAWEAIRQDLQSKGRLAEAPRYTHASGKLAVLLYKEDLERALRTRDLAGIQLLQLQDFPGQSTATVGLLDAFWDSKGLVSPEEFRRFCAPTVPLLRMEKMVYQNDETFTADLELAHFGAAPLRNAEIVWRIREGDTLRCEGKFTVADVPLGNGLRVGKVVQSLAAVGRPSRLSVSVEIAGTDIRNDWNIWVYPATSAPDVAEAITIFTSTSEGFYEALRSGNTVLLLPAKNVVRTPIDGRFIPVFWSPLHFPNQPGTLGAMIDPAHPMWGAFPTGTHTDWQWWELTSRSFAVDMAGISPSPAMPFRFVDKYNRNALPAAIFEAAVGAGKLFVCTLDITTDLEQRIAARQLRRSILEYLGGGHFNPKTTLSETQLGDLFQAPDPAGPVRQKVSASSSHYEYPAELAVDGRADTFWHSDWSNGAGLPAVFTIELPEPRLLRGFHYTPRADLNRGRIADHFVEVSSDGTSWRVWSELARFPDDPARQTVRFERPVNARFFRLTITSDHGQANHAAIAELELIAEEITPDVRDLGPVPGLNDQAK